MISSIEISNFKSFEKASLALNRVTFLVGLNGSGKTNLLELLRFENWLAKGGRLDDMSGILGSESRKIRARLPLELVRRGTSAFATKFMIKNGRSFALAQEFNAAQDVKTESLRLILDAESLQDCEVGQYVYRCIGARDRLTSDDLLIEGGASLRRTQALYYQLNSPSQLGTQNSAEQAIAATRYVQGVMAKIYFLTPDFAKLAAYVPKSRGEVLDEDGTNLSAVAFRLNADPELRDEFFSLVRALPEREFNGIGFSEAPLLDEVMLVVRETSDLPMPLQLLSDGTKRVLMIAASLLTVPTGSLLVFEEIDTGIHPSRVAHLVKQIYRIARARQIQVLITSHNTDLLNSVPQDEIANIVVCHRDPLSGTSRLTRFGEMPEYGSLVMRSKFGSLMTSEAIEKSLRNPTTEADRHRRFEALKKFLQEES